jgi:hypothetical protein
MSLQLAQSIVGILETYAVVGLVFAVAFLPSGLPRLDPGVAGASWMLRLLLLPGIAAFWPLFGWRWITGRHPIERNAHRDDATAGSGMAATSQEATR